MTAATPVFRPLAPADTAAVVALWHQGWHDGHAAHLPEDVVAERTPETFAKRLAEMTEDGFVATIDGTVVAFAALWQDEVDQFYVARAARGTGLARRFLSVLEGALLERGVNLAKIQCAGGNARAHAFYTACGWRDGGLRDLPLWTADGRPVHHPTHLFEKFLTR